MKLALGILALALLAGLLYHLRMGRKVISGPAYLVSAGRASCKFDGPVAVGNYAVPSNIMAGACHDTLIKESEAVKDSLGQYIGVIKEVVTKGGNGIGDIAQVEIKR